MGPADLVAQTFPHMGVTPLTLEWGVGTNSVEKVWELLLCTHRTDERVGFPFSQHDAQTLFIELQAILILADNGQFCKANAATLLYCARFPSPSSAPGYPAFNRNLHLKQPLPYKI